MQNITKLVFIVILLFSSLLYAEKVKDKNKLSLNNSLDLTKEEKEYLKKKKIIKACTNPNWTPIEFIENEKPQGISIDTITIIANKLNMKLQFIKTISWKESQEYLKDKKCDILPSAIKTAKREKYAIFSKPYLKYDLAIITKKDKPFVSNLESIIDKKMSRKKGSGLISKLKQIYPNITIKETRGYKEAFEDVLNDNVYFTIATIPALSYYKNRYGLENLQVAGYTKMRYNLSVAVRKDDKILLNIIDKVLINIPKDTLHVINNKWSTRTIIKEINYTLMLQIAALLLLFIAVVIYRQNELNKYNKHLEDTQNNFDLGQKIANIGIWNLDYKKNKLDWTLGVSLIFEIDPKNFNIGFKEFINYVHPDDRDKLRKAYKDSVTNKTSYFIEYRIVMKDGTIKYIEERCQNFFDKNENILKSLGTILDITSRKKAEKELEKLNNTLEEKVKIEVEKNRLQDKQMLQQSRLAQMGEMISMIAHQWRQPLTAISATTSNLTLKLIMDNNINKDEFQTEIDLIADYSQHLSKTIDDFRGFFKTNKEKEKTTLTKIVTNTLNIVKTSVINKNIKIVTDLECEEEFETYSNEVKQVILNLIKNAEDILIEKEIKNPTITIKSICGINCDHPTLIIKDNAGGVPEDIIDQIFNPYFSTKKEKDGTGLGLYMSKTIIEEHCGGKLSVSNDDDGAVFTIKFKD